MSGFLGIGEKLFALPWSALTLDPRRKCFVLGVEKDRLKTARGFDKDHWPSLAESQWATTASMSTTGHRHTGNPSITIQGADSPGSEKQRTGSE